MLVIADQFDEDWEAFWMDADGTQTKVPIFRTNLIMRGIPIARAENESTDNVRRLRLVYRPKWVIRGSWVGGLTIVVYLVIIGVSVVGVSVFPRRRRQIKANS